MGDLLMHNMGQQAMARPPRQRPTGGPDTSGRYPGQPGYYGGSGPVSPAPLQTRSRSLQPVYQEQARPGTLQPVPETGLAGDTRSAPMEFPIERIPETGSVRSTLGNETVAIGSSGDPGLEGSGFAQGDLLQKNFVQGSPYASLFNPNRLGGAGRADRLWNAGNSADGSGVGFMSNPSGSPFMEPVPAAVSFQNFNPDWMSMRPTRSRIT